jgi:hypothetical protein
MLNLPVFPANNLEWDAGLEREPAAHLEIERLKNQLGSDG